MVNELVNTRNKLHIDVLLIMTETFDFRTIDSDLQRRLEIGSAGMLINPYNTQIDSLESDLDKQRKECERLEDENERLRSSNQSLRNKNQQHKTVTSSIIEFCITQQNRPLKQQDYQYPFHLMEETSLLEKILKIAKNQP